MVTTRLVAIALLGLATAAGAPPTAAQSGVARTRQAARARLQEGQSLLDAGRFVLARQAFDWTVENDSLLDPPQRAAAHFGRGLATHEIARAAEPDDSSSAASVDTAIADYLVARTIDSARYFARAHYNAALLLSGLGEHRTAATYFRDAALAGAEPDRRRVLLRAARELELSGAGGWRDAEALYKEVARAPGAAPRGGGDSIRAEAQLALSRQPTAATLDSAIAWLSAMADDSSLVARVPGAALAALGTVARSAGDAPVNPRVADTLLLILAKADVGAHVSPEYFRDTQRDTLIGIAGRLPTVRDGIHALVAAYEGRERPPAGGPALSRSPWWNESFDRRHVWTGVLRTVGEWNERAGRDLLAAQYYEAAIGYPDAEIPPWADLDAILPLVLMLDRQAKTSPLVARDLDRFMDYVFTGKAVAYSQSNWPRIRQFHMTLGAYYAQQRQWTGQPRGAIFQLEHMRTATARLRDTQREVYDPPQLLEQLMEGYLATRQFSQARATVPALRTANTAAHRPDNSAQWRARIDSVAKGTGGSMR